MSCKTNKSASKRFKVTKSGKLLRRKPGYSHLLRRRSTRQKRAARTEDFSVSSGMTRRYKAAMNI